MLAVAGRPILDYILDRLEEVGGIDEVDVVTNAKFAEQFARWVAAHSTSSMPFRIAVLNDGSTDEGNRLGAIGDIAFTMRSRRIEDDVLVVAGDNLLSGSLKEFGSFCREKNAPVLGVYNVGFVEEAKVRHREFG